MYNPYIHYKLLYLPITNPMRNLMVPVLLPIQGSIPKGRRYHREVPALPLRALLDGLGWPKIDLLKLDCEGSEPRISEDSLFAG